MPSEEANNSNDNKGKSPMTKTATPTTAAVAGEAATAPSSKPPASSKPPPAYAQAKNAYEQLWKQHSDTRPLATQAPVSRVATASPPEAAAAAAGGINATAPSPATPPPLKLHAFQKLVGDEAFIPASSLKVLKRIGAGSFATGERDFWRGADSVVRSTLLVLSTSSLSAHPLLLFLSDPRSGRTKHTKQSRSQNTSPPTPRRTRAPSGSP